MSFDEEIPESMLGSILAFEGIAGAQTIVNGPTGCKYPPAAQSEELFLRRASYDPYRFMNKYYFSQPRVPCTYMDSNDLILGTDDKLKELGEMVLSEGPDILGVVNSPGAALIGAKLDVIVGKDTPVVAVENPGYSGTFEDGFQDAMIRVLETLCSKRDTVKGTVNIIGISIRELSWMDDEEELAGMLSDCGIKVNAFIGAGCTVDDIRRSTGSEANILLHRDMGDRIGRWYEEAFSIPTLDLGLPLGFDATERWIEGVCGRMGKDPSKVLSDIKKARTRTANQIKHINSYTQIPAGCTFSISADGPLTYHITDMLYYYLGMLPVAIDAHDDSYEREITSFLGSNGLEVSDDVFSTEADIFLGSGTMSSALLFNGTVSGAVNVECPRISRAAIRRRPLLGINGTMNVLDEVMNSLDRVNCQ